MIVHHQQLTKGAISRQIPHRHPDIPTTPRIGEVATLSVITLQRRTHGTEIRLRRVKPDEQVSRQRVPLTFDQTTPLNGLQRFNGSIGLEPGSPQLLLHPTFNIGTGPETIPSKASVNRDMRTRQTTNWNEMDGRRRTITTLATATGLSRQGAT